MRRMLSAMTVLALCLSGCATDKTFEKEILGHPAPESPNDTGWSRTPPPPPPPPPAPAVPPPAPVPAPAPATPPQPTPAPVAEPGASKLFTQPSAGPVTARPAQPAPGAAAAAQPQPASPVPGGGSLFTFQVGAFAHAQSADTLMSTLQGRGYVVRVEQGKLNNKQFYKVVASKAGARAALEGELFSLGVTEPRLIEERPAGTAAPRQPVPEAAAAPARTAPAPQPAPRAGTVAPAPTATSKPSAPIAPPIVEPAPPLPDGYVPPPPKKGT